MAFSPDGRIVAAADADGTVVLFDVATDARVGRPLHAPYGPIYAPDHQSRDINGIAFSPDGRLLATAGNDGSTVLWDLAKRPRTGRPLRISPGYSVTAVAFSPDGCTLASGVDNGKVVLTRVPDGNVLHELIATGCSGTSALAFSPDGKTLATVGLTGKVRLWDPRTGEVRGPASVAEGGVVMSTSFSPDGSVLATSGSDGTAALWDVGSGKRVGAPLTGPPSLVVAVFAPTGHTVATAFCDGTVLLWDVDPASWRKRACAVAGRPSPHRNGRSSSRADPTSHPVELGDVAAEWPGPLSGYRSVSFITGEPSRASACSGAARHPVRPPVVSPVTLRFADPAGCRRAIAWGASSQ